MKEITYRCDICREKFDAAKLFAFQFSSKGNRVRGAFSFEINADAPSHICGPCLRGLADLLGRLVNSGDEIARGLKT